MFTPLTLLETLHTYFYWFFSTFQYWPIFVVSLIQINIAYKKNLFFTPLTLLKPFLLSIVNIETHYRWYLKFLPSYESLHFPCVFCKEISEGMVTLIGGLSNQFTLSSTNKAVFGPPYPLVYICCQFYLGWGIFGEVVNFLWLM